MEIITKKWPDGYFETEITLEEQKDESLIKVLVELAKVRLGGNPENGWRIQRKLNVEKLGENFILDTIVDGKHKDINFFIGDKLLAPKRNNH